jgi:hypothetical protein
MEKAKGQVTVAQANAQAENCRDIGCYIKTASASKLNLAKH